MHCQPDKSCSRSMDQMPSVSSKVFPSDILRVMPEGADLWHREVNSHESIFMELCIKIVVWVMETLEQMSYLSCGISCVPEGISEVLSWASGGVDHFNGQARVALGLGGFIRPVGLCNLLPHHDVEPRAGLVAEHKASVVVIPLRVDKESPTEVNRIELVVA